MIGKIAELCKYLKDNLSNSVRYVLDTMYETGEIESIIAETLIDLNKLTPETTGLSLDDFLNNCQTENIDFIAGKVYTVTKPIVINKPLMIDFKGATIKYIGTEPIDTLLTFGYNFEKEDIKIHSGIKNVNIDCNSMVKTGLHIVGGKGLDIEYIAITNAVEKGLVIDNSKGQTWEVNCHDVYASTKYINCKGQDVVGICPISISNVTDSFFNNLYAVNGSDSWIYVDTNACKFNNIHGYAYPDEAKFLPRVGFDLYGNGNSYSNLIVDTADMLGIEVHGNYNSIVDVSLGVKAGGVGIKDSDFNEYDHIKTSKALGVIISSDATNYLNVKNLRCVNTCEKDIELIQGKVPYEFHYDESGKANDKLRAKFRFMNQFVYTGSNSLTINLPIQMRNALYRVDVVFSQNPLPFYVERAVDSVTIKFNENLSATTKFDVYITNYQ